MLTLTPSLQLHYKRYGQGKKTLVTFHGFGQTHLDFAPFHEQLQNEYTIYSFDLYFHGDSPWLKDDQLLQIDTLYDQFLDFFSEHNIKSFSVAGYSMGGKFALGLATLFPSETDRIMLIAPDGLHKSMWIKIATGFPPVKGLFNYVIDRPWPLLLLFKLVKFSRLVNHKMLQFGESQMATQDIRSKVYHTWIVFRAMYLSKNKLTALANDNNIELMCFLGKYDRIIPPNKILPYTTNINKCVVKIFDKGHGTLINDTATYLASHQTQSSW